MKSNYFSRLFFKIAENMFITLIAILLFSSCYNKSEMTLERIRLRGIDAPELNMPEGREARAFVERALGGAAVVALKTYKTDRYARYVADVFYDPAAVAGDGKEVNIFESGRFLNREIIEAGHAFLTIV